MDLCWCQVDHIRLLIRWGASSEGAPRANETARPADPPPLNISSGGHEAAVRSRAVSSTKTRDYQDQIKAIEGRRQEMAVRIADALAAGRCEEVSKKLAPYAVLREELLILEALAVTESGEPA